MKRFDRLIETRGVSFPRAVGLMATIAAFAFGLAHARPNSAQTPTQSKAANTPKYEFEVATFKPSTDHLSPSEAEVIALVGMRFGEDSLRTKNTQLRLLIQWAYGLLGHSDEVVLGGPKWLDTDRYDITAKMDSSVADQLKKLGVDQREIAQQQMVQSLLADRLKLKTHRETRVFPVYALTIAKGGLKLHEAKPGDTYDKATFPHSNAFAEGDLKAGHLFGVGGSSPGGQRTMTLYGFGVSIPALATKLNAFVGMIVQDKTGLTGKYDFTLKFAMIPMGGAAAPDGQSVPVASDPAGGPGLLAAIQQQLGLKLESTKGPVEVVVIDHVEKPSGN
jgi:uncharacterized protein (TIGR03435 family)